MFKWICGLLIILFALSSSAGRELADYVTKKDPNWSWSVYSKKGNEQGEMYILQMTSQQWLTEKEVDHPLWKHGMVVYIPKEVKHATALLMIGGGSSNIEYGKLGSSLLMEIALRTGSVTAMISNVPNQPLVFADDPEKHRRFEDDILAYQWARHLKSGDAEQLALLPMVKSAVRAMDTVTALCAGEKVGTPVTVKNFVVTGKSKRGWTSWLTAAVDRRVVAIAPQVIDMLNMQESMKHQNKVYGKYAEAVDPYVENGIMAAIDTPESEASLEILDPYSYRKMLTIPKMIINSGGDQFFLPDSSQFYFDDLSGPKYLRYIPNCGHGLDGSEGYTLLSFYSAVLNSTPMPGYSWSIAEDGQIMVETELEPLQVNLWQADNPLRRDFRIDKTGKVWTKAALKPVKEAKGKSIYTTDLPKPEKGWRAFFVELVFAEESAGKVSLTSGVSILPQELPH